MITDPDPKMAEALKSLTTELSPEDVTQPSRRARGLALGAGLILAGMGIFFAVTQTDLTALFKPVPAAPASTPDQSANAEGAPALPYNMVAAPREINGSGYVSAPQTVHVFTKYEGVITGVEVATGDKVTVGQILLRLDNEDSQFSLEQANNAKESAALALEVSIIERNQAEAAQERMDSLVSRQVTSVEKAEQTHTAFRIAAIAVLQARQNLAKADIDIRIAQERVNALVVTAPMDGVVTRLDAHVGDTVLARADSVREEQSLLTLIDMTALVIDADVAETNIAALKKGQRGEAVLDGFPDQPFAFEIKRLEPVVSAEKGTVSLHLVLNNPPEGIRPNMAARIRISLAPNLSDTGDTKQ